MDESKLIEVKDQATFEHILKKRIAKTVNIGVYYRKFSDYPGAGKIWYVDFEEEKSAEKGQIVKNAKSKIFVNATHKVVVYVSVYGNEDIVKELDYIHNNYCFAMGTKRNTIPVEEFFVMIFINDEGLDEGKNYGDVEKGILAYDGGFEDKMCIDFVIAQSATAEDIADTLERYMLEKSVFFKEILWEKSINSNIKEIVFVVEPSSVKMNFIRKVVGTIISGEVIELADGDEVRIYVGNANADYVMRTYGESILDCKRQVIQIQLPNNLLIKIYQKNAPEENNGDANYWLKRIMNQT